MDCSTRIRSILILEKMEEHPETNRKLGLKDRSYFKKRTKTFRRGDQP